MTTLSLLHWDYNRVSRDIHPDSLTVSIAVYQWRPKASGKSLKKVNACRVCGYLADVSSVYAKAQSLCDRLNAENASADSPPRWLQKQYSVPKPKGWVDPRVPVDLPGSVVRSIRTAVMKRTLAPAGFVKGKQGTYVRRQGDQIHLIDFQPARFGHEYTVNLAFHYVFLKPLFAKKRIDLAEYSQIDCGLRARIGDFAKARVDQWIEYGTDRGRLERTFEQNARDCLRVFDLASAKLGEPSRLLRGSGCLLNERLLRPWMVLDGTFAPLLALHLRRRQAAIRHLEQMIAVNDGWKSYYLWVLKLARRN